MPNGKKLTVTEFWKSLDNQRRALIFFLTLSDLLAYVGISVIAPFFPKEANARGVSNTVSGWIFGIYALSKAVSCPFFGALLPHVGARFMYLSGMFVSGCCTILFGICGFLPISDGGVMFAVFCMIVRIILALGMAAYVTAGFTIISLEYHEQITFIFSIVQAGVGVGFIAGPSIGGVLYEFGGFLFPFVILGSLQLIMFCVNFFMIPRRDEYAMRRQSMIPQSSKIPLSSIVFIPLITFIMLGTATVGYMFACLDATLEPGLRPYGMDTLTASFCFLTVAAAYTIMSPIVGYLCNIFHAAPLELFGIVGMGLSELVMCSTPLFFPKNFYSLPLVFASLGFIGFFGAFVIVPSFEWMKKTAVQHGHEDNVALSGAIGGLWNSANAFGDFLGPVLSGMFLDLVGFHYGTTYLVTLSLPLTFGLIFICIKDCIRKRKGINDASSVVMKRVIQNKKITYDALSEPLHIEDEDDSAPLLGEGSKRSTFQAPVFRWQTLSM